MLKQIINYLKNNQIDCHADKSARNGRVCHYSVFALCRTKQFAFTLAETLIVVGIIGVIATLTLPNLNSSTADKEKVVRLQKLYSDLNAAVGRASVTYGPTKNWCSNINNNDGSCSIRFYNRIKEFLKYKQECTVSDASCSIYQADNGSRSGGYRYYPALVLPDGLTVSIGQSQLVIDLDGASKGSATECDDLFELKIKNNAVDYGCNNQNLIGLKACCTRWVLTNGNMDFKKLKNGKCPDGKTILDWTTNTSCK